MQTGLAIRGLACEIVSRSWWSSLETKTVYTAARFAAYAELTIKNAFHALSLASKSAWLIFPP
jgi:hypothetical protein